MLRQQSSGMPTSGYSVEELLLIWGCLADSISLLVWEVGAILGPRQEALCALFYGFSIESHIPSDHELRSIDDIIDLSAVRVHLAKFYSSTGRPSI